MVIEHISLSSNEGIRGSEDPAVTYAYITDKAGVGETSVYKIIKSLKDKGWIRRNNGRKCGNWVILKK